MYQRRLVLRQMAEMGLFRALWEISLIVIFIRPSDLYSSVFASGSPVCWIWDHNHGVGLCGFIVFLLCWIDSRRAYLKEELAP
jgi:hypothetical protein